MPLSNKLRSFFMDSKMSLVSRWWLVALTTVAPFALANDCSFYAKTGAKVSPRSGDCTITDKAAADDNGKSGLERCVSRDGNRVISEMHWKQGKRDGPGFYFDNNDRRIVATFKDDLAEGPAQVFSKQENLLCQMNFGAGVIQGAVREFYPSGKLKGAYEIIGNREGHGHIELLEDGKVRSLQCTNRSLVPEDLVPCGFDNQLSRVQLHDNNGVAIRNVSYWQNGKLTRIETVDRQGLAMTRVYLQPGDDDTYDVEIFRKNGKLFRSYATKQGKLDGAFREYSEEGAILSETVYEREHPQSQRFYFMNGKMKRSVEKLKESERLAVQEFWDNGKLKIAGTFIESQYQRGSWENLSEEGAIKHYSRDGQLQEERNYLDGRFDGDQKLYFASGILAVEQHYEKDQLRLMKCYDPIGKLELIEEYYQDGSLKSGATEMTEEERSSKRICRLDR
jgi:antitoxin component YwqK of YwqJK toxin-antitoxin module